MSLLVEALRLTEFSFKVFSLNQRGLPYGNCERCRVECEVAEDYIACGCLSCHGPYAGTNSSQALSRMWINHPESLLGIRTGALSDCFVMDFDQHAGGANGLESLRDMKQKAPHLLPQTISALTGGGGIHLYYRWPEGLHVPNSQGRVAPGVDVRGEGGFVIAPPSQKPGRPAYRWYPGRSPWEQDMEPAPAALLALVAKAPQPQRVFGEITIDLTKEIHHDFREALFKLEWAGQGSRNGALYFASCRGGEAVAAGVLKLEEAKALLEQASGKAGMSYQGDGVPGTIRSGLNRGLQDFARGASA